MHNDIGYEEVNWVILSQGKHQLWVLANTTMKWCVPLNVVNILTS
jgi:hypothetical protein